MGIYVPTPGEPQPGGWVKIVSDGIGQARNVEQVRRQPAAKPRGQESAVTNDDVERLLPKIPLVDQSNKAYTEDERHYLASQVVALMQRRDRDGRSPDFLTALARAQHLHEPARKRERVPGSTWVTRAQQAGRARDERDAADREAAVRSRTVAKAQELEDEAARLRHLVGTQG